MHSPAVLFRKSPRSLLQRYFVQSDIELPEPAESGLTTTTPMLRVVEGLTPSLRDRVLNDFDRIGALSDEAGQTAVYSVAVNRRALDDLQSGHARSLWMFLNEPTNFRRAEEVRYTDQHRRGRQWCGFLGRVGVVLNSDAAAFNSFEEAVRAKFNSSNVYVDVFRRQRKRHGKDVVDLIQATVYFEGRPEQDWEFIDERLDLRDRRPVIEAAITYEPASGSIEAVASGRPASETFVRLFAETVLRSRFDETPLPLRHYDLDVLRRTFDFPTDADDGIESVLVNRLRLRPLDTASQRITLECMKSEPTSIWEMSASRFGGNDPLAGGWVITKATFTITFRRGVRQPRRLPVTITMPHGCDLKDNTNAERLIGEKYLRRWGLIRNL